MKHANVEDLYRLTPIQEGILFHALQAGEASPYFEQFVFPYGELDIDRFERSWRQAIERHPVLRTSFVWEDVERPVQVVHRRAELPFASQDWRILAPVERDERLRSFLAEDRARGFALDRPPLLRLTAFHWDDTSWRIVWSYHHLLLDGWSANLLLREVATFYHTGDTAALEPRRPFRDYIGWLRQQDLAAAEAWWRRTFEGFTEPTVLGIDRAPGHRVRPDDVHAEVEAVLPAALTAAVGDFARRQRLTLHTLIAGAWALALARYSGGAEEVVFGNTLSGRPTDLAGADAMIGCFINTLPVRVRTAPGQELIPWLHGLQTIQMELRRHEHSPLVEVRRWSGLPGDRPLFETILVFESFSGPTSGSGQNGDRGSWQGYQRTNFPLTLVVWPRREIVLEARYYESRFEADGVSRLLGYVRELLQALAEPPAGVRLDELPALPAAELLQLAAWNGTEASWALDRCLHERIAGQAARTPDAVAVVFPDARLAGESLTYAELDARADQLARYLRRLGVRPEGLVGVAMERSPEMVVALLGVLKAGGAYVPLDPAYPAQRLAAMAEDAFSGAATPVVLAQSRVLGHLPERLREGGARVIPLDEGWDALISSASTGSSGAQSPDSLAYVIFTSGSTGRPKGAMNSHRGIVNRLLWMQDAYRLGPGDCVLQKTPFSFDVSVWEFFWPLLTGARLVLAAPEGHREPAYLVKLIAEQGVTTLHFVPSMLQVFLEEPGLEGLACLRRVMASGEALTAPLVERFFARLPRGVELHNLYGPTEAAVDVTAWACAPGGEGSVPIGRPVSNTRIHLLDQHFDPVPVGVPGELYIGGVQVGRGYLGRTDLTAGRFLPDPFGDPGARLYATGDLARWRPDGAIEYLGRVDHQVKIHGFRIELGEIEAVLAAHRGVREAVVLAREDEPGSPRLAAYVVPAAAGLDPREVQEHLRQKLPELMVPADFMVLGALPLSPNGKVDRKALPAPGRRLSRPARVAPRNPTEEALAAVWTELLKAEPVGVEDDFFALGGDSIKAVRLVSRVNARLGADLRVPDVFRHPTIASLAVRLGAPAGRGIAEDHALGLAAIERLQRAVLADEGARSRLPEGWEDFFPLSGIEKGMIYYTLLLPDQPIYHDQYAYLLSIGDIGAFFHAFELLVGRHPTLRSTFHLDDFDEPMKVVHARIPVSREVEDLSALPVEEQGRRTHAWRMADLRRKFTFRGELLWRLKVFRLQEELYSAVWTWHHAILDGWSNLTFWFEMNQLYGSPGSAALEAPAPLASTYKDYLAITLGRGRSPATEAFWRETLAGAGRNRLPFQRTVARAEPSFGMRTCDRALGRDLLTSLRARAAELGASIKAVCLAAHLHLLHVTAGEDDVVTGVVSHDRPGVPDGDRIIGCFLNTVPVRLRISAGESGASLILRVSHFLAAESEHEIPLVDVAALVGARDAAGNPIFDTLLNFMDYHLLEESGGNALFRPEVTGSGRGAFDLERYEMTNTLFDLEVSATLGRLGVRIKYAPSHFEAADVERAAGLYERILEGLARDIEAPLGTEALLSDEERTQLVRVYNDTARASREYPRERPLHSFFEERAALHPDLPAVLCGGRALTYGQLDRLANRVARLLLARGVEPGDNVGVCLERSTELVAALFGVLKAGAAYVPLEPSYPAARKDYIARQSAVSFLLEELPEDLAAFSDAPVPLRPRPDDLAYTIYTSGSTGTPKGVMIEHQSAVNLIAWVNRTMAVRPGDRVLMVSSVCFDLSVYDVFGTLAAGGEVIIARPEEVQDPAALARLVFDRGITFWNSVPSTLGLLVQFLEETDPELRGEELRVAFLSGDWIPLPLPERARRFFPNLEVISLGGATEGTVWSIFHPVGRVDASWLSIPYGRPLDNNAFYVLDRHLELVPPGVVGDLYIGGSGIARGYAGDAAKTAASFVPDLFAAAPGARLYRTGDLGRMMSGGEIEFLGRSDHQVKVRGFRVELGEIESQLARHPGVREGVVLARSDRSGQKSLCGYVVASAEVTAKGLREHLSQTLPGYMIPDTFVFLPELPLSPNGKIDRKALPEPEAVGGPGGFVEPSGEIETALARIWEEVLGIAGIGARHDFFALGGHSLSAIQVLTRVRRRFAVDLPLPDFFDEPTIVGLAAAVERLRQTAPALQVPPLDRRERPERLPLSFAQERLWFLDQLQPGSPFYNLPMAFELRGDLSVAVLAASLTEVARRHEALRTAFPVENGAPLQAIAPALDLAAPLVDLAGLPDDRRNAVVSRLAREWAVLPFDLARGPLVRLALLRLEPGRHIVLASLHHIVTDGWSMALLIEEVAALYPAFAQSRPSPLPELPLQYADYALWQRERLAGDALERETAWWRQRLAGAPYVLDLPADRARPAVQSLRGTHAFATFPEGLARGLQRLAQEHGATPFMVYLALFAALLHRTTAAEDLLIGSPIAGRNHPEVEKLIGLFVNTLVLRVELAGEPALTELLARVRDTTLGAYTHQDLPFEKLVEELQPERSLAHTPLFQVMLILQNAPMAATEIPGLRFLPLPVESGTARFDLHLALTELPAGLLADLEYNQDLFESATIIRLLGHLRTLAEGAVAAPGARLADLPFLSAAERHQLLLGWNDTGVERAPGVCLHELSLRQARRAPEAPAVVFEGRGITYGELDRLSGRLAARLCGLGVGPDTAVGVLMERSIEMVVGLLGILRAGGAYLPLDPDYPADRLGWMMADARVPVLLAQERLLPAVPPIDSHILLLEEGWEGDAADDGAPSAPVFDQGLAYVLYTSGSTGKPKGVMIPHRGIVNRLLWMQEAYGLTTADRVLQKTPFSFDVSVWELFWPLLAGACLVVARPGAHRDPASLVERIEGERVTVTHFVPSMLQAFLETPDLSGCASLRLVAASGEALGPELRRRFHERLTARLENLYGPTEAAVDVTAWSCAVEARGGGIPIGRPVANTRIHLVDRSFRPVPIGVPGELCIGGVQLARGYWNRPDLTAERFVPDPWTAGGRLYRTGDLARHLPDGAVEFLGRLDFQVKVRGFRIELGEIEAVLASHSEVRECAVLAREDAPGERRLAAYVVPNATANIQSLKSNLGAFLASRLPDHMVPAAWTVLAALPLTPSGKVDRRALPAPEAPGTASGAAPGTALEQVIAAVWAEILRVDRGDQIGHIGREDTFFDLGGDSIRAVRLVNRLNERLGADLRVQDVFKHQTVGALAARIGERPGGSVAAELAAGRAEIELRQRAVLADERQRAHLPQDTEDFFPLSGIEKGMIYYTLLLPDQPVYHDQHAYLLSIADPDRFFRALALLTGRHPVLRSTFHLDELAEPMKVVHRTVQVPRDVEDLSGLPAGEQRRRIELYRAGDLRRKFTFQGELLWRLKLFRLDGDLHASIWTWHHAILDGWSNLTFWLDLNELLAGQDLDRLDAAPPLASSYKDYLAITLGRSRSAATETFWRETLADAGRNRLPFHRAASRERPAFGMKSIYRRLRPELLRHLRARAAETHTPLQALFLAAHLRLLAATTGEDDVVTGVVSHDRPAIPDGDKIVGCFLNTFPLRLRLEAGESGASLIRRTGRYLMTEKEHEIPLVDVAAIVGARESAQNPIFDTLLNFMDFHLIEEMSDNVLFRPLTAARPAELPDLASEEMTNTLFDVEVSVTQSDPFLRIKYAPRHFEAADVERAAGLYERILEGLARDIEAPLGTETLLSGEERIQLVQAYNDTAHEFPRERPLHSFFEERAALHPDLPAVLCGGHALTYGQLDRLANRVARLLLARGVEPGDNVGVCLERSTELVAALFGVLKAGAAYVPLEPSYPAARKDYIARQSAVSFLLEELPEDLAAFSDAPVPLRPRPDDLAYTIYTSGSTGTPKGVMIEHQSAVNLIAWVNRTMAVRPGDRVLMVSSVCFDLSVYDVFGTLAAGGEVIIARPEEVQDPAALARLVFDRGITFWNSVPSTLGLLVQFLEETDPELRGEELRVAFLSGDWIPLPLPERARRFFPNLEVISLGGATEGTVWSIFHPVGRVDASWLSIPYGRPIDNNAFYVLDRHLELVPPGVVGDLYIGGSGIARGYAGDAAKTAASFVPDLFAAAPGARLYRTGDLGRMMSGGEIEFLGRSDHQVKVRGFRVELGEIESQLARHPGVREGVVLARSDRSGQKSLCGYVVAPAEVTAKGLREHLSQTLPGYMIPDTFVFLPELPLSPNGKVDRKALPEPEAAGGPGGFLSPSGEIETALARIWEEVLGIAGIGARHDFFALGGHSLSAIQVLTRVRRRFAVDLPLPDFFGDPTIAGLAAAIERLRRDTAERQAPPLRRTDRPRHLPLSFAQERLWFLDRLTPESSAYNLPLALAMSGHLSWPVLVASLSAVIDRHEALRTTFAAVDGQPVQVIAPASHVEPPLVDLRELPGIRRDAEARRLAREEAARPFDLARGPLVRTSMLRLGEESFLALFTLHHIIADGWSMGLLVQELGEIYGARLRGGVPVLPELPVQYADFALWQRSQMAGEELARHLSWWRERLAGAPAALELPTDRPRPATQRFRGAQLAALLPVDLSTRLARLQQTHGATPFMVLLAAYQVLLARLAGQDDLVVGSPVANRNRLETESLIGFFANTLALRGDLSAGPSFAELLERVREVVLGALAHEDLPFERLVEELNPERSLARSPLFQVVLVLQNAPLGRLDLPGLALEPVGVEPGSTKFDLTLSLTETPRGLFCLWEYDSDLFDAPTVQRLQGYFAAILAGAAEAPAQHLSELSLLAAVERHQLLLEWSSAPSLFPEDECVPRWIEAQAALSPAARAVAIAGLSLTYAELNARANQVARHLRRLGVGPQAPVGICVERSLELVVGVLGILKAGGAYVPLDPSYPVERLAGMLADAFGGVEPAVVLSQARLLDRLHGERGTALPSTVQVVALEAGEIAAEEAGDLPETPHPADLAYIIYTSGSTGRPKGVPISHRALARSTAARFAVYREPVATFLLLPSFAFDSSVAVLFWTLCQGGTLVLPAEGQERDPRSLLDLIARHHVSHWLSVPSLYAAVLETAGDGALTPLRTVVVAGEACPADLVPLHRDKAPTAALYNEYGPTEAAVWSTVFAVPAEPAQGPVLIGRAVPGARVYVLDREGRPVPPRVAGELCIGGMALAWGYLGQPELTAERFVPDPCSALAGEPGARLYRTGDLVRHQAAGDLEFLGRVDDQVKIRGFRIEPGEIEAALVAHPAVREAAVVVREDGAGGRHLVAYFASRAGEAAPAAELRAFLRERLPAHMVPVLLVALASLPLTPNGKVDRQALPVPEWISEIPYVAPRTAVEEALATIWGEILKRERIGIHDNFFDLGGHSLLATRVVSRIHADLQVEVPLREMFESRTLADLAAAVEARSQTGSDDLKKISETLAQLEQLSEEQVRALLQEGVR